MTTIATLGRGSPWIGASSGIALANLHPDSELDEHPPEIDQGRAGGADRS